MKKFIYYKLMIKHHVHLVLILLINNINIVYTICFISDKQHFNYGKIEFWQICLKIINIVHSYLNKQKNGSSRSHKKN